MKPVSFKQVNTVYGKDQPDYIPLPAHRSGTGEVISCWQLNLWERIKVLFTGRIYVTLLTYNNPLQPQKLSTKFEV